MLNTVTDFEIAYVRELGDAFQQLNNFTASLIRQQYVDEISPSDSEVIGECQIG